MLLLPNRLHRIGSVLRCGMVDPRKNFNEANLVSAFCVLNNDMWFCIHQMLCPINLPCAEKHCLKLCLPARLDAICNQHRLRSSPGRTMMCAVSSGTRSQRDGRKSEHEMCNFHIRVW